MAILAYKPKSGNVWNLFGEGQIEVKEGFYQPGDKGTGLLYVYLDKQSIIGKDSSIKNAEGKASNCDIPFPIQAVLECKADSTVSNAVHSLFTAVLPDCCKGFTGALNLTNTRSASRIRDNILTNKEYDLGGGLCEIEPIELSIKFEEKKQNTQGGKTYKSAAEIAQDRAKIVSEVIGKEYQSVSMTYLHLVDYHETLKLNIPTPLEFANLLIGGHS